MLWRRWCQFLAVLAVVFAAADSARASVWITPRHLLVLREGLDSVTGSYVFALQNTGDQPEHFKAPLMLPKETEDFVPQEGAEASELSLAAGGGVVIDKDVPPGVLVVSIGFRVPAHYGHGTMTLTPSSEIQSLNVLVPKQSGMQLESPLLVAGDASNAPDPQYLAFVTNAVIKPGETVAIELSGLPEGRARIWIIGAVVAGILVLLAGFFAWRTRPKITSASGSSVLVG